MCPAAGWVLMRALSWAGRHETDGRIPGDVLDEFADDDKQEAVKALVEVGFLESPDTIGYEETGEYQIHDYLQYNPSREDAAARRAASAERKARQRA